MSRNGFSRIGYPLLAASLAFGAAAMAQNQPAPGTLPDAQIEANVLRALASAPELSTQNIQSSTVYGTVTLTGNVHDEAMRTQAENLVARAVGVKKVVDELSLGDTAASSDQAPTDRIKMPHSRRIASCSPMAPARPLPSPPSRPKTHRLQRPVRPSLTMASSSNNPPQPPSNRRRTINIPEATPHRKVSPPTASPRAINSTQAATDHRRIRASNNSNSPMGHRTTSNIPAAMVLPQTSRSRSLISHNLPGNRNPIKDSRSPMVRLSAVRYITTALSRRTLLPAVNRPASRSRSLPDRCFASASIAGWTPTKFSPARRLTARFSTTSQLMEPSPSRVAPRCRALWSMPKRPAL